MPYYLNVNIDGLIVTIAKGDGYAIDLKWATAYSQNRNNKIGYNIYMNSDIAPDFPINFFNVSPTFVSVNGATKATIVDLIPGTLYHFAVRAFEYNKEVFDPAAILPEVYDGLLAVPQSLLSRNILATDNFIPLVSTDLFPSAGIVKIGAELIAYSGIDNVNIGLNVPSNTNGTATLVDQGGGNFYVPFSGNTGTGTINSLTLVDNAAITETWTIKCVEVLRDTMNHPIPNTARFATIGSLSGSKIGGQEFIWIDNGVVLSNGILSFSITELTSFKEGDYFTVKVLGTPGFIASGRGFDNTIPAIHNTDGYDGYTTWNPEVMLVLQGAQEEQNTRVFECWNRFDVDHYPFTITDGYRQKVTDILTTNLTYSDEINTGFPAYDFSGYHRTDPVLILNGTCVGSYIGGTMGCVDGYSGVGLQIRGVSIQDQNMQRQEVLLSTTGEPVCLIQRNWTGVTCKCMLPYNEYPEARCPECLGTGIVIGWSQFFDTRRSDGRIMVRFDPTVDDLIATESGLESTMQPNCWTLPVPSLKDRSVIVRFDENDNEEFRYEILNVTRNKLLLDGTGAQKFVVQRIRKTDIIYQIPIFRDTSTMPMTINTGDASSIGFPVHNHTIQISETITSVSQINQVTSVASGHSHVIRNGKMLFGKNSEGIGHIHTITLP